jgi:DNA-binding FadR family transcriptional regulator
MDLFDDVARVNAPSSVSRRRLNGAVAHQLAVLIIGGRLKPGEVLPNENVLSASLSVSRTAYREALRVLVAKGLVTARPKTGTTVNARADWNMLDPDVLSWHFEVEPSPTFIMQLFELRMIVEPAGAALAAERHDAGHIATLREMVGRMKDAPPGSISGLDADLAFHHTILLASGNEPLLALSSVVGSTLRWSVRLKMAAKPRVYETALPGHVDVVEAIAARDGEAARRTMSKLVESALAETLQTLAGGRKAR